MKKRIIDIPDALAKYVWSKSKATSGYWLTRFVFLRLLGIIYFFAFLSLVNQVIPLIGENGLLPATKQDMIRNLMPLRNCQLFLCLEFQILAFCYYLG